MYLVLYGPQQSVNTQPINEIAARLVGTVLSTRELQRRGGLVHSDDPGGVESERNDVSTVTRSAHHLVVLCICLCIPHVLKFNLWQW